MRVREDTCHRLSPCVCFHRLFLGRSLPSPCVVRVAPPSHRPKAGALPLPQAIGGPDFAALAEKEAGDREQSIKRSTGNAQVRAAARPAGPPSAPAVRKCPEVPFWTACPRRARSLCRSLPLPFAAANFGPFWSQNCRRQWFAPCRRWTRSCRPCGSSSARCTWSSSPVRKHRSPRHGPHAHSSLLPPSMPRSSMPPPSSLARSLAPPCMRVRASSFPSAGGRHLTEKVTAACRRAVRAGSCRALAPGRAAGGRPRRVGATTHSHDMSTRHVPSVVASLRNMY